MNFFLFSTEPLFFSALFGEPLITIDREFHALNFEAYPSTPANFCNGGDRKALIPVITLGVTRPAENSSCPTVRCDHTSTSIPLARCSGSDAPAGMSQTTCPDPAPPLRQLSFPLVPCPCEIHRSFRSATTAGERKTSRAYATWEDVYTDIGSDNFFRDGRQRYSVLHNRSVITTEAALPLHPVRLCTFLGAVCASSTIAARYLFMAPVCSSGITPP